MFHTDHNRAGRVALLLPRPLPNGPSRAGRAQNAHHGEDVRAQHAAGALQAAGVITRRWN